MMTFPRYVAVTSFALALLVPSAARSAETAPAKDETRAEVSALDAYHDVIRTIWHDAWPNKDVEMLRALLPEVRDGADAVLMAELPGILRDKREAWESGVKELHEIVAEYSAASEGADDQRLLDAAERLHAQYEKLVRVIRPALKELDAFHVVLYRIYHHDMPADDLAAIRVSVKKLKPALDALERAELTGRLKARQEAFATARGKLSAAVDKLAGSVKSDDLTRIKGLIETVHSRYQAVVAVFD